MPLKTTGKFTTDLSKVREQLKKEKEAQTTQQITVSTENVVQRDRVFTQEELQVAWSKMQESDIHGNHHFHKIILEDGEPEMVGNHSIKVNLHNKILREPFNQFKRKIFKFLSDELSNDRLHLELNIVPPKKGKKRIYTSHEKFEHLAELNPSLISLKQKLGLDFDE